MGGGVKPCRQLRPSSRREYKDRYTDRRTDIHTDRHCILCGIERPIGVKSWDD